MQFEFDGTVRLVDLDWEEKAVAALKCTGNECSFFMCNFVESGADTGRDQGVHSAD